MLVQTSNSFNKVFSSLSIVSENWGGINEWRSTYVRLRQFEAQQGRQAKQGSVGSSPCGSDSELVLLAPASRSESL